jgi:hypothetical protein
MCIAYLIVIDVAEIARNSNPTCGISLNGLLGLESLMVLMGWERGLELVDIDRFLGVIARSRRLTIGVIARSVSHATDSLMIIAPERTTSWVLNVRDRGLNCCFRAHWARSEDDMLLNRNRQAIDCEH